MTRPDDFDFEDEMERREVRRDATFATVLGVAVFAVIALVFWRCAP